MLEEGQTAAATESRLCEKVVHIDIGVKCGFYSRDAQTSTFSKHTRFCFLSVVRFGPIIFIDPIRNKTLALQF